MDQSKAARLAHNVWVSKHFAIAMGAIMVIFIVCHWIHVAWFKYGRGSSALSITAPIRYLRYVIYAESSVCLASGMIRMVVNSGSGTE